MNTQRSSSLPDWLYDATQKRIVRIEVYFVIARAYYLGFGCAVLNSVAVVRINVIFCGSVLRGGGIGYVHYFMAVSVDVLASQSDLVKAGCVLVVPSIAVTFVVIVSKCGVNSIVSLTLFYGYSRLHVDDCGECIGDV